MYLSKIILNLMYEHSVDRGLEITAKAAAFLEFMDNSQDLYYDSLYRCSEQALHKIQHPFLT